MSTPVEPIVMLRKHQWAGTAYGGYGSTARKCPECGGLHPDDSLNNGGGSYTHGLGHNSGCELFACICEHERLNDHGDACLDCGAVYCDGEWQ